MWNLVVMYGSGPFDVLSFAEDNIVGALGNQSQLANITRGPFQDLRFERGEGTLHDSSHVISGLSYNGCVSGYEPNTTQPWRSVFKSSCLTVSKELTMVAQCF